MAVCSMMAGAPGGNLMARDFQNLLEAGPACDGLGQLED